MLYKCYLELKIMSNDHLSSVIGLSDNLDPNMRDLGDVNCLEQIKTDAVPSDVDKHNYSSKQTGKGLESIHRERKKKTRRGKPKRKKPYNKEVTVSRIKNYAKSRSNNCSRFRNSQPVAPNNTNEFLMEDHKDIQIQELDERLQATATKSVEMNSGIVGNRPARVRDSSFTSADSDEEYFYSSPEDEEEFLTKDFSNTYKDLHAESLQNMTKPELIQHVLQLETKIDCLEQRLGTQNKSVSKENSVDLSGNDKKSVIDKGVSDIEGELQKWKMLNEQLAAENMMLKRQVRQASVSTVDSESDSSSSSGSSASSVSGSDNEMNYVDNDEDTDHLDERDNNKIIAQGICSMESDDVT